MNTFQCTMFVTSIEHKTVGEKDRKLATLRGAVRGAGDMEGSKRKDGFITVEVWGQQAEFVEKFIKEKSAIEINGQFFVHQWTDDQTGKNREQIKWIADRVSFAPVGKAEGGGGSSEGAGEETSSEGRGTTSTGGSTPPAQSTRDPFAI